MLPFFENRAPEICIAGRCDFSTGIGRIGFAFAELLARAYPVSFFPLDRAQRQQDFITLPTGRTLPICKDTTQIKVCIFTDILWNGAHYDTLDEITSMGVLRICALVFDSDSLPQEWVDSLHAHYDVVLALSPHLEETLRQSGVTIPIQSLPLALDIEDLIQRPYTPPPRHKVRFGSVSAFHPRKCHHLLIDAFYQAFGDNADVSLTIHSNGVHENYYHQLEQQIARRETTNITLSRAPLSEDEKNDFIAFTDVIASCARGEGYAIAPREALALGKPLVLSAVGGHLDLQGVPGVFMVTPQRKVPARYPEIDNRVFGFQQEVAVADICQQLLSAYDYVQSPATKGDAFARRRAAWHYSFSALAENYAALVNPERLSLGKRLSFLPAYRPTDAVANTIQTKIGWGATALSHKRNLVIPAHDGGFFSNFNVYLSHLVWNLKSPRTEKIIPDWDLGRLQERNGDHRFTSFCYGTKQDGNIWTALFAPVFGLSVADMAAPAKLYENAEIPEQTYNQDLEPNLTSFHAYQLYKAHDFSLWRQEYHQVFKKHVHLKPEIQSEIDSFTATHFANKWMIAAHVKHPSHSIEQPSGTIPTTADYIRRIQEFVASNIPDPNDWSLFLATDQDSVVAAFRQAFGARVCFFADVKRTTQEEDSAFAALPAAEKAREGFQIQHRVAQQNQGSTRMAVEVLRDAYCMAQCRVLFHVVSNVSTAVSYINPEIEMVFL